MVQVERGDGDFAEVSVGYRIACTRPYDFQNQIFVDYQTFVGGGLIGDQAQIGGTESLISINATRLDLVLQRLRKRRAGHQRTLDRRNIPAGARRRVEQDLEKVWRTGVGDRSVSLDQFELLL